MNEKNDTLGDRLADKLASFGGSWSFLIFFGLFMGVWILGNSIAYVWDPRDPYPFIFLNLILSCLASIQAPVIMMSQNRQEAKDRLHAQRDYEINLKAELEILKLHEKIDQLHEKLIEMQDMQIKSLSSANHPIEEDAYA